MYVYQIMLYTWNILQFYFYLNKAEKNKGQGMQTHNSE